MQSKSSSTAPTKSGLASRVKLLETVNEALQAENKRLRDGETDERLARQAEAIRLISAQLDECRNERDTLNRKLCWADARVQELNQELEKAKNRRRKKAADDPPLPTPHKEMWRRLVQLCHPDRHANSEAANAATRWLMEVRP